MPLSLLSVLLHVLAATLLLEEWGPCAGRDDDDVDEDDDVTVVPC